MGHTYTNKIVVYLKFTFTGCPGFLITRDPDPPSPPAILRFWFPVVPGPLSVRRGIACSCGLVALVGRPVASLGLSTSVFGSVVTLTLGGLLSCGGDCHAVMGVLCPVRA